MEEYAATLREANPECTAALIAATEEGAVDQFLSGEVNGAVIAGKIDAEVRRKAEEKGGPINEKQLGYISLAVIVNAKLPIEYLIMDQARKVFSGMITNWKELGGPDQPIEVATRAAPEHGAAVVFQRDVLKGAPFSGQARVVKSYHAMASICGKSPAIGYIPTASIWYQKTVDAGAKPITLAIDQNSRALHAPLGLVVETEYPLKVPVTIYWRKAAAPKCLEELIALVEKSVQ